MEVAEIRYLGHLKTEAIHLRSKEMLITDAPVDNNGKGEAFSPTDLTAVSLGSCVLTIMGIAAQKNNIAMEDSKCAVTKVMSKVPPRRIAEIDLKIEMPKKLSEAERKILENAAFLCPVKLSLHPEIKISLDFQYRLE